MYNPSRISQARTSTVASYADTQRRLKGTYALPLPMKKRKAVKLPPKEGSK